MPESLRTIFIGFANLKIWLIAAICGDILRNNFVHFASWNCWFFRPSRDSLLNPLVSASI